MNTEAKEMMIAIAIVVGFVADFVWLAISTIK